MSLSANQQKIRANYAANAVDPAAKTGGPKTEEGKAKSALNSRKHGLYAETVVFANEEEQAKFEKMAAALEDDYSPRNEPETLIVSRIATCHWRVIQGYAYEAKYRASTPDFDPNKYTRAITAAERALAQAEKQFQLHRAGKMEVQPPKSKEYRQNDAPNPKPIAQPRPIASPTPKDNPYIDYAPPLRPGEDVPNPTYIVSKDVVPQPSHPPIPKLTNQGAFTPDDARHFNQHGCQH